MEGWLPFWEKIAEFIIVLRSYHLYRVWKPSLTLFPESLDNRTKVELFCYSYFCANYFVHQANNQKLTYLWTMYKSEMGSLLFSSFELNVTLLEEPAIPFLGYPWCVMSVSRKTLFVATDWKRKWWSWSAKKGTSALLRQLWTGSF